jgi:hypothetical protein
MDSSPSRHPLDDSSIYLSAHPRAPRGDLASPGEVQLGEDVLDVVLRGAFGDHEPFGDLPVGEALCDQLGDLSLARAQRREALAVTEVGDECAGALDIGRHAERAGQAVGLAGGGGSTVDVAGSVAGGQSRRQVVVGFADETACPCPVGLSSGVRQIVNGHVEAVERDRPRPRVSSIGPI